MRSFLAVFLALAGCTTSKDTAASDTATGDTGTGDTATGDTDSGDTAATGERTLANCETTVPSDAPAFYQLFRCVTVTVAGDVGLFTTDLPPHESNYYPEDDPNYEPFDTSRGDAYAPNPNQLSAQSIAITIPSDPVAKGLTITADRVDGFMGTDDDEYSGGPVGVAIDGVALFNAVAAQGDDIEQEKYTFDRYNGHPQQQGMYHYHGDSMGPLEAVAYAGLTTETTPGAATVEIYGIMCDGTVVLGCTEADGSAPTDDLDAQGGHVHDIVGPDGTTWFADRYHTHVCETGRHFTPELQYYQDCGAAPHP